MRWRMDLDKKFNQFKKDNPVDMQDAESNMFQATPKSSVKLVKNSKGVNWEIKLVKGEENLLEGLMIEAVRIHNKLKEELE
jgi:hypothetical protein